MSSDEDSRFVEEAPRYDVVVIGSGSGGIGAAKTAAKWGARTLLVDKEPRLGGDCTWFGCVPSKALIRCARAAAEARQASRFGVVGFDAKDVRVDWAQVQRHIRSSQEFIYKQDDSPEALAKEGVETILGHAAKFVDEGTVSLTPAKGSRDGSTPEVVHADKFVLCTGAGPSLPPIAGLETVPFLTYETIFDIPSLPGKLIVVGGGPIGSELAQAFARLGSKVTLVGTLLPREDEDVRGVMRQAFLEDGVTLVDGRAQRVQSTPQGVVLWTSLGQQIEGDRLLIASGRRPKGLEALDLEAAGVNYDPEEGIAVDAKFRTSSPNIYAVGDCLGGLQFTHLAGLQGGLAGFNAVAMPFGGLPMKPSDASCPRCTFTHPEVASVGLSMEEAREKHGKGVQVSIRDAHHIDRAVCEGDMRGFIKVLHTPDGKILGATVVSPVAGELVSEIGVAMASGTSLYKMGTTMHAYPTFSFGLFLQAADFAVAYLKANSALRVFRGCCARRLRGNAVHG